MAAAILGFSGVLQSCPGFQSIINFVMGLKMNPYLTEFFGLNILAGILGSGTSSIAMFFEHLSDGLLAKGASAGDDKSSKYGFPIGCAVRSIILSVDHLNTRYAHDTICQNLNL